MPVKKQSRRKSEPKPKMLYRSKTNRVIAGVCGGIGEYFDIDPTIIRILWIVFCLAGGAGLFAYIICWIVIPEKGERAWWEKKEKKLSEPPIHIFGILLIALGGWLLLNNLGWLWWINFNYFWPAALIFIGAVVILLRRRNK